VLLDEHVQLVDPVQEESADAGEVGGLQPLDHLDELAVRLRRDAPGLLVEDDLVRAELRRAVFDADDEHIRCARAEGRLADAARPIEDVLPLTVAAPALDQGLADLARADDVG